MSLYCSRNIRSRNISSSSVSKAASAFGKTRKLLLYKEAPEKCKAAFASTSAPSFAQKFAEAIRKNKFLTFCLSFLSANLAYFLSPLHKRRPEVLARNRLEQK
jgi:hypothetical protein